MIRLLLLLFSLREFFTSALADGLSLELSERKSPQVSRTRLSILVVLNNAVVWVVSTRPPTSKSSSFFSYPLVTVPKTSVTIGIIINFKFHSFSNSLVRSRYLSFFSHSLSFIVVSRDRKVDNFANFLFFFFFFVFLVIIIWSCLLAEIRWSMCMSYFYYYYYGTPS